jgi:hypothetical protein
MHLCLAQPLRNRFYVEIGYLPDAPSDDELFQF